MENNEMAIHPGKQSHPNFDIIFSFFHSDQKVNEPSPLSKKN